MATRAKLHGKALHLAEAIKALYDKKGDPAVSHRSCRMKLAELVCDIATQTNVEPRHFADYVPNNIVEAIARERTRNKLKSCGVTPLRPRTQRSGMPASGRDTKRFATAA